MPQKHAQDLTPGRTPSSSPSSCSLSLKSSSRDLSISTTTERLCACKANEECADCAPVSTPASDASNAGIAEQGNKFSRRYKQDSWFAWTIVMAGCIQGMITLGASRAHGVYQEHYILTEFPDVPTASISWIGSVQNTALNLCGVFVGILSQIYDTRIMCAIGSLVMGLAFILASFSTQIWQLVLTQGVMYGSAASFPYILGVTVPLQWIRKQRGLALAVVYLGSGVGGMWISIMTESLIDSLGRQWANRILGFILIAVGLGLSPLIVSRPSDNDCNEGDEEDDDGNEKDLYKSEPKAKQQPKRRLIDISIFAEWKFALIAAASFFAMGPNTIPYLLMPTYVVNVLGQDRGLGSTLVTIINVSGIFGRFVAGMLSDRFGPVNIMMIWVLLAAISQIGVWLPFASVPAVIASAAMFGVTGASFVGMIINALSHIYGVSRITYISGLIYMTYSISSLLVTQTTSMMLDTVGHGIDYTWPIVYTSLLLFAAFVVLLVLRLKISRRLVYFV
ncbi:hypothetical protein GGI07_003152 [Coemansia sp. Benny D115]|nr:hypothetical protein GGI07_003152 [Coemansia sp. Benny D115]